jgi:hypothetical protein
MPGFFDILRGGFIDVATGFYDTLKSASEQSVIDQCSLQELSSTAKLAEVDMLVLGYAEEQTGQLPLERQKEAAASVNAIKEGLAAKASYLAGLDRQDPPTTTASMFNPGQIRRAATDLAQLSHSIKLQIPTLPVGDTIELQPPNTEVQQCLDVLYQALTKQLSSNCNHQHVARLKLTGFTDNIDDHMRFFFDLFLSSRFDWTPCRWLQSRCTIEK